MLDLRQLRAFREVARSGGVRPAAEVLGYTPSAVSQHVAALERRAGVPLFERGPRGLRPLPSASALLAQVDQLLEQAAQTEGALAGLRGDAVQTVRLTAFPSAGPVLVARLLAELRAGRPALRADVRTREPDEAFRALRAGEADVALVLAGGREEVGDDVVLSPLGCDRYALALPGGHPLAARRAVALDALDDQAHLMPSTSSTYCARVVHDALQAAGVTPRGVVETDDYPTMFGMVAEGLGVALVAGLALVNVPPGVAVRRLAGPPVVRHAWVAVRAGERREHVLAVRDLATTAARVPADVLAV